MYFLTTIHSQFFFSFYNFISLFRSPSLLCLFHFFSHVTPAWPNFFLSLVRLHVSQPVPASSLLQAPRLPCPRPNTHLLLPFLFLWTLNPYATHLLLCCIKIHLSLLIWTVVNVRKFHLPCLRILLRIMWLRKVHLSLLCLLRLPHALLILQLIILIAQIFWRSVINFLLLLFLTLNPSI